MDLTHALRLQPGDVVAFVGAGGKTGSIRRIMQETAAAARVLATTTTNLGKEEADLAPTHFIIHSVRELEQALSALPTIGGVLLTGPLNADRDKWTCLPEACTARLVEQVKTSKGLLFIEADGARRKGLKAPAEHEPAIPPGVSLVVPMINLNVIGQSLTDGVAHRPERIARLLDIEEGDAIKSDHIAQLAVDGNGGLKNIPGGARVCVFLNGAGNQDRLDKGRTVALKLVGEPRLTSILIGDTGSDDPVAEVWGKTGIVILAAGASSRFGSPKLLEIWRGKPILRHVVETALASAYEPVIVVLGADHEQLSMKISDLPVKIVHNPNWSAGQSTSLIIGLEAIKDSCEAVIFMLGDMPAVGLTTLEALVETHRKTLESVVAPLAGGRWGNPVLFDRRTFEALTRVEGDRGGRVLFDRYPPHPITADESVLMDIDRQEDLDAQN